MKLHASVGPHRRLYERPSPIGDVVMPKIQKRKSGVGLFLMEQKNLLTLWDNSGRKNSQQVTKVAKTAIVRQFW
jgi:hypothetical protein